MGLSHAGVAHAWIHAPIRTENARAKGHALFFEGDTIYSYGKHFPIARIVQEDGRLPFVLFTTAKTPSSSTARHMTIVKDAIPAAWGFGRVPHPVDDLPNQSDEIKRWYVEEIADLARKAERARTNRSHYLVQAENLRSEGNRLAERFSLGWTLPEPGGAAEALDELRERDRARAERLAEKRRAELQDRVREWRAGEHGASLNHPDILLRVKGKVVQTSRGAEFPVSHAKRAWPWILNRHNGGTSLPRRIVLGPFVVDSVDEHGNVTAGCHFVKWEEIERLAGELGLIDKQAA